VKKKKGLFITFEGVEGSGKSTQIELLKEFLSDKGYDVVATREPGGTRIGDKIRKILLNPDFQEMDCRAEALLYAASRAQHVAEIIAEAVEGGKIVISDRYTDSSLAYQSFGRGLEQKRLEVINEWATGGLEPDLTILLDIPADKGLRRTSRSLADRIEQENLEFHDRVSKGFLRVAKKFPRRIRVVNASRDVEEIHQEVVKIVGKLL
jgi:dTMP kinase